MSILAKQISKLNREIYIEQSLGNYHKVKLLERAKELMINKELGFYYQYNIEGSLDLFDENDELLVINIKKH